MSAYCARGLHLVKGLLELADLVLAVGGPVAFESVLVGGLDVANGLSPLFHLVGQGKTGDALRFTVRAVFEDVAVEFLRRFRPGVREAVAQLDEVVLAGRVRVLGGSAVEFLALADELFVVGRESFFDRLFAVGLLVPLAAFGGVRHLFPQPIRLSPQPSRLRRRQDHLLHDGKALDLHEHVLGTA